MNDFDLALENFGSGSLYARSVEIIQVEVGRLCNLSCSHCHLGCSPDREEVMSWAVMEHVAAAAKRIEPMMVEIIGGAPELNQHIRDFIRILRREGHRVQLRTNLTAMAEPGQSDLPQFFKDYKVKLVAALPCHTEQYFSMRGCENVYEKSIRALKYLSREGYVVDKNLQLDFLYNPGGTAITSKQTVLGKAYRQELYENFNVSFSRVFTIANMPNRLCQAWHRWEQRDGDHCDMFRKSFKPEMLDHLMCRNQISIGWDGEIYDCDFNLALDLVSNYGTISGIDYEGIDELHTRRITTGEHCFGCAAGDGTACWNALV